MTRVSDFVEGGGDDGVERNPVPYRPRPDWDYLITELVGGSTDPDAGALGNRIEVAVKAALESARAEEREACAKIADQEEADCQGQRDQRPRDSYHWSFWERARKTASGISSAIRSRALPHQGGEG